MLSEFLTLTFDTALYYVLSSYWIKIFSGPAPIMAGALLLLLVILLQTGLTRLGRNRDGRGLKPVRLLVLLIPLAVLAFHPSLAQSLQMLPAWLYLGYCALTEGSGFATSGFDLPGFRDHFRFGARLLLGLIPGFLGGSKALAALALITPYLTVMLATGVGELRYLRDGEKHPLSHALWIGGVIGISWLAAVGGLLRLLGRLLFLIYDTVIARVLYLVAMGISYLVFGILTLIKMIADYFGFESAGNLPQLNDLSPMEEELDEMMEQTEVSPWLDYIAYAILAGLVILILFFMFRKLAARSRRRRRSEAVTVRYENLAPEEKRKAPGFFRPSDPRLAVRFYFLRFLREARKRGLNPEEGMTGQEIAEMSSNYFREGDARELYALYAPARYSQQTDVSPEEAEKAREEWKKLKHG
ncbi:MAG: DUF4129 domain-containing protein [Firmicutes bacterium]|nr:DUF4129 domain-containing protein [Bacillota bacterium]